MIVQPSSIGPRSPRRRVVRAVGLVAPVVLFLAVVGVGLSGPAPEAVRGPEGTPTAAPAVAVADPSAPPSADAPAPGPPTLFPGRVAGLEVHGVHWTLEARSRGLVRSGVVAIAGYLALDEQPSDCVGGGLGVVVPFCERTGVLANDPWSGQATAEEDLPPYHLHPQVPSGVRVPYLAASAARLGSPGQPVVILARFDDPRAETCTPAGRHCGQELVVERIGWFDGEYFPRTVTIDPGVPTGGLPDGEIRDQARYAVAQLGPDAYPLLSVLVRAATLAEIHPEAAAQLPPQVTAAWYVRGLREAGDPTRIDWLVVDAVNEVTLASGAISTRTANVGGSP